MDFIEESLGRLFKKFPKLDNFMEGSANANVWTYEDTQNLKSFLHQELGAAYMEGCEGGYERGQNEKAPMGVSQWREHGKKYGYWDFFEKQSRAALVGEIEKMKEKTEKWPMRSESGIEYKFNMGYNQALQDVLSLLAGKEEKV